MLLRKNLLLGLCLLSPGLLLISVQAAPLNQARQSELESILYQDCGSCHGMTLKGGLGPALTPDALLGKPREYIRQTIREGHPDTPMPPWKSILSPEEIDYIVDLLKKNEPSS